MSLKFKRNLPIILLLVTVSTFLTMAMGNQCIVPNTVSVENTQTGQQAALRIEVTNGLALLVSLPGSLASNADSQVIDADNTLYWTSGSENIQY